MITLKDVFVKPGAAEKWAQPQWAKKDIKNGLLFALWEMTNRGFYAPYVEKFPVATEEEFSEIVKKNLENNNTFACTDGGKIYIDTVVTAEHFNKDMERLGRTDNVAGEMKALLAHEYTHILCEHHAIGEAINRQYNNRVPKAVCTCHVIACEIQANRGSGVGKDTLVYKTGVTEDHYPETKGLYTYSQIFAALLKTYNQKKKEMEKLAKQIADMMSDELSKKLQESEGKSKEKSKGNGKGERSQEGDGTIRTKKTEDVEEHPLTEEEIKEAIDRANSSEQEVYDELVEFGGGYGLNKVDDNRLELKPDTKLKTEFKRWDEQRIKAELKRMKGYVRGSFSRERESTYARPTRRLIDPTSKLIRKGVRKGKSLMPRVLVAMDSSGSMGGTPVTQVATAIGNLFKDLGRPTEGCYIVKHESQCSDPYPLSQWEEVVESFRPCGGNCFNNVVKLANELNVDVVFNIGDGCDCCIRNYNDNMDEVCSDFIAAGRKWVDTLILDKKNNDYFDGEWNFDHNRGFDREILQLGSEIEKYL